MDLFRLWFTRELDSPSRKRVFLDRDYHRDRRHVYASGESWSDAPYLLVCWHRFVGSCFFTLVLGVIGTGVTKGIEQANTQMKRMHPAESNALAQLNVSNQQLPVRSPNMHASLALQTNGNTASRHEQAIAQANRAAAEAEEDRAKTRESVRQAEQQRDRINEKQKQIERLQKSLDWYDEQVRNVRAYGGNDRLLVEQRDQLLKQKWELEGR
jgi:hypothetical protein